MQAAVVIDQISSSFEGIVPKSSWGETSLFYNPGKILPNGIYFCTIKENDGENDTSSNLTRDGIYRLSFGIGPPRYETLFGARPARPAKGGIIQGSYDFSALDKLMPHPVYGWMSWVQILNPSEATLKSIAPLIEAAYVNAVSKFNKKTNKTP